MTIKTLIDEEISKGNEPRRRSPSIVARLMGLEEMPAEVVPKADPKFTENPEKCKHVDRNPIPAVSRGDKQHQTEQSQQTTYHKVRQEFLYTSFQDHSQEQQLHEFKKQSVAWKTEKVHDVHSGQQKMQPARKPRVTIQKQNAAAIDVECRSNSSGNGTPKDKNLQRPEEFVHALEVLHANKDLCLKFLKESNSLFENYSQDGKFDMAKEEKTLPELKSLQSKKGREIIKDGVDYRMSCNREENQERKHLQRLNAKKFQVDNEEYQGGTSSFTKRCKDKLFSLPTRIVVLKPSKGKYQNSWLSPSPTCSPRSQTGQSVHGKDRPSTHEFLVQVREKLKMSFEDRRDQSLGVEQYHGKSCEVPKKMPQQYTRQIAKRLPEDIGKMPSNFRVTRSSQDKTSFPSSTSHRGRIKGSKGNKEDLNSVSNENSAFQESLRERLESRIQQEEKQSQITFYEFKEALGFSGKETNYLNYERQEGEMHIEDNSEVFCDLHQRRSTKNRCSECDICTHTNCMLGSAAEENSNMCINSLKPEASLIQLDNIISEELNAETTTSPSVKERPSNLQSSSLLKNGSTTGKTHCNQRLEHDKSGDICLDKICDKPTEASTKAIETKDKSMKQVQSISGLKKQSAISQELHIKPNNSTCEKEEIQLTTGDGSYLCDSASEENVSRELLHHNIQSAPLLSDRTVYLGHNNNEINPIYVKELAERNLADRQKQESSLPREFQCDHQNVPLVDSLDLSKTDIKSEKGSDKTSETVLSDAKECPLDANKEVDLALELVKEIPCPKERYDDLLYISNVLISVGFASTQKAISSNQYGRPQAFNTSFYERIEECYRESTLQKEDPSERDGYDSNSDDHLLFDYINETLLEVLKPYCHQRSWVTHSKTNLHMAPTCKQLLETIWGRVFSQIYPQTEAGHELEAILAADLSRAISFELEDGLEEIGCELGQQIMYHLIEELVCDLLDKDQQCIFDQ
eukprot:TRINITY_DN11260_c0_g2_i4.p1 TRINITY_DN11260_c0_g2~~TRINITY_DN11260_c0_g2_i4.p1  ORF type:complete len:973 (-),score=192.60 TRINITY_DN11260_c0_g2_i4:446-3364(-)